MRNYSQHMLQPLLSALVILVLLSGCGAGPAVRTDVVGKYLTLSELVSAYESDNYNSVIGSPRAENIPLREQALRDTLYLGAQIHIAPVTISEHQFTRIDPALLPIRYRLEYQLIYASFLKTNDLDKALKLLRRPAVSTNALKQRPDLFARFYHLRAEISNLMGLSIKATNDYIKRELFLVDLNLITANQTTIWKHLSLLPQENLDSIILGKKSSTLQGWADLISITRELTRFPALLAEQMKLWKRRYPEHPAQKSLISNLLERSSQLVFNPKQIAVLLPLSGSYAKAAAALRDGIITSHLADPNKRQITLRFYDTAGDVDAIETLLQKAIKDGAEFILGPLKKKVVQRLLTISDDYSVPILTLNMTEGASQKNTYQFSLSPEGEAIDAASRAWHEGYSRVSMLLPENNLGKRMSQAFRDRWLAYGGTIVNTAYYNPKLNDFSTPIKSLLDINRSEARRKALRKIVGEKFEFIPRLREDIELIFLSAHPRQARIIKPQLRFHHAADIQVIATSHLYRGKPNRELDRDMNGILFGDMPWNIRQSALSKANYHLRKKYSDQLKRLVAMGIDSYQIIPLLPILSAYPSEIYQGESGQLSLNKSHQIERKLSWSQFRRGRPRALKDIIYTEPTTDNNPNESTGG